MPGIPLLNFGTALGGLAGGWNQARNQGLQQAIQQFALQQAQGQTNSQTLASLALQLGLMNQPGGGQTPLGAATGAVPNQTSTPTPPSSGYNYTPPVPGGAQPGYAPPLPGAPPAPGDSSQDTSPDSGDLTPAGKLMHNPQMLDLWQSASGYDPATEPPHVTLTHPGGSDSTPEQKSMPTITATPGQVAPGGIQSGDSDSGQQSGGGSSYAIQIGNGPSIPLGTFFQRTDYQKLAQGIEALAPPGTSQADIYGAVVDLAKLAEGDKTQQQQAGLLLRALVGGNFKMQEIVQQGAIKSNQIAQAGNIKSGQIAQAGDIKSGQITQQGQQRSNLQTQKDTATEQRQQERLAQQKSLFDRRLAQANNAGNVNSKNTQLRALLGDIDKQINPGGFSVPPSGDDLLQLQQQRAQVVNELRKLSGLPPTPIPQAPPTQ